VQPKGVVGCRDRRSGAATGEVVPLILGFLGEHPIG
jgi:hypothetical protein